MSIININGTINKNTEVSGVMGATAITGTMSRNASIYANIFLRELLNYCQEAKALIERMETTPTKGLMDLIDKTILDLKAAGIWDITDMFHKWDLHTPQASMLDWKNAIHNASNVGGSSFIPKRGLETVSYLSHIELNFIPSTDCVYASLNDLAFSIDDISGITSLGFNFGAKNTANNSYIMYRSRESDANPRPWLYVNSALQRVWNANAGINLYYLERTTPSEIRLYKSASIMQAGTLNNSVSMINQSLVLGGYREYNGGVNKSNVQTSTLWLGSRMSLEQRTKWYNIINYWKANLPQTF